jgi:hypothetical protein
LVDETRLHPDAQLRNNHVDDAHDGADQKGPVAGRELAIWNKALMRALLVAFALGVATGAAAQERWATYANPRFGTTIDYPADFFAQRDPPPANGDGQSFRTRDGRTHLAVWGAYNVEGNSPQGYVENFVAPNGGITYRQITPRYFVVSGTRNDDVFYQRCNFAAAREGVVDCFEVTYPAADKAAMDKVVPRLGWSLRSGAR